MRITANHTTLFFDVEGPQLTIARGQLRARPTIVALHGGPGFDQGYLRPGLSALAADAQLLYVDLRGQGRSAPAPAQECTLERMADDVAALCHELGVERPVVLGHSAGGFVALHLALRHPALAAGLILCHTAPTLAAMPDPHPPAALAERAGAEAAGIAARLFGGDFSPQTGDAFARLVFPHYAGPDHTDVPARIMSLSSMNADIAAHFFAHLAPRYDLRPRLAEITLPTLVIVGRHDWVCPPAGGRAIADGVRDGRLVELPGAGHFGFSETPQPFLAAVRSHLARLSAARDGRRAA